MIHAINSPQHAIHTAGFIDAMADRASAYRPDHEPRMRKDWMTREDIVELATGCCLDAVAERYMLAHPRKFGETDQEFREKLKRHIAGWIEHDGSERPVPLGTPIQLIFRGNPGVETGVHPCNQGIHWDHRGNGGDIIAYRLHKPQPDRNQPDTMFIDDADTEEGSSQD